MNGSLIYLVSLVSLGIVIAVPSYITMNRQWPGPIAGFEPSTCSDVKGVTRRIGGIGVLLGSAFVVAGVAVYVEPRYRTWIIIVLAAVVIAGSIWSLVVCNRLTRR